MAVKKATPAKKVAPAPRTASSAKGALKAAAARVRGVKDAVKGTAKAAATKATAKGAAKPTVKTAAKATVKTAAKAPSPSVPATKAKKAPAAKAAKVPATTLQATATPLKAPKVAASTSASGSQRLRVRQGETPWTAKELREIRAWLEADVARLNTEISAAESDLAGLMRDAGDGAGDDQADAGTKTFEREQEISLANNAREMFEQSQHALERMVLGSYGVCESCGNPIGKNRLLAFPRATLCMPCKSKQERR